MPKKQSRRIYGTGFKFHELFVVAESLKQQIESLIVEFESKGMFDRVWKHLNEQLPHHGLSYHRGFEKVIRNILEEQPANGDASGISNFVMQKVLFIGLNNIDENPSSSESSQLAQFLKEQIQKKEEIIACQKYQRMLLSLKL